MQQIDEHIFDVDYDVNLNGDMMNLAHLFSLAGQTVFLGVRQYYKFTAGQYFNGRSRFVVCNCHPHSRDDHSDDQYPGNDYHWDFSGNSARVCMFESPGRK
jgi:hypothetical protein